MSWTAISMTGRKRPLSFSSMKKLFPSEICNSNSRYCVCNNMTLTCYLKYPGTVIIISFIIFSIRFLVWSNIGEELRDPLSEFSLLSSVQVPFNTGHCRRRILCHCWLLLFNKILQVREKLPCQRHSGLLLVDLIITHSCSCIWLIYLIIRVLPWHNMPKIVFT